MNKIITLIASLFIGISSFANNTDGYRIEMKLKGFVGEFVIMAYHYGNKQYIADSVFVNDNGLFVFEGEEPLDPGMYMVVMPPKNNSIDILIDRDNQQFSFETNTLGNMSNETVFKNSPDNTQFYTYLNFLSKMRQKAEAVNTQYKAAETAKDEEKMEVLRKEMENMNDEVVNYQNNIIQSNPKSFTALFLKASQEVTIPDPPKDKDGNIIDSTFQYRYYKAHYLDNLDLSDERLVRTPLLHGRVMNYFDKVVPQHFDSIIVYMDDVLEKSTDEEMFKYLLVNLLNKYAKSNIVGMDAVYVHLVNNYYKAGKAPWTDEDQLMKIMKDAAKLEPLLLNKVAPNFKVKYISDPSKSIALHDVKAEYTVLIFWAPDCGHCKKEMPKLVEFYNEYKNKGVKIFSVCSKIGADTKDCAPFIEEKGMEGFINVFDPDPRHPSRFAVTYDVTYTPIVFILDENKVIQSKRIAVEQLGEVITNLNKLKARQEKTR